MSRPFLEVIKMSVFLCMQAIYVKKILRDVFTIHGRKPYQERLAIHRLKDLLQ